jgi:hypothetical protein
VTLANAVCLLASIWGFLLLLILGLLIRHGRRYPPQDDDQSPIGEQ